MKIDGSIWISNQPVQNIDNSLFKATQYSYNQTFGCAVKSGGTVWCWGSNSYGALGIGDTTTSSSTFPVQVVTDTSGTALTGITSVQVAESGYTACAIGTGGAVWCWGYGQYGQLGTGLKANSPYAVPVTQIVSTTVTPLMGVSQISVAYYQACAVKTDNTLWCWGDNSEGQIGIGSTATTVPNATQVSALFSTVTSVATTDSDYYVTCATTMDGSAYCWGGNGYGMLGNGLMSGMALVPSQVLTAASTPLTNANKVVNWGYKLCVLESDATMWCWGTTSDLYAMPLIDSTNAAVTGITVVGRLCYLDNADLFWYNGSKSGYQITCP
jgi:alpha-tubulin suppressor-like RCC1 family protein